MAKRKVAIDTARPQGEQLPEVFRNEVGYLISQGFLGPVGSTMPPGVPIGGFWVEIPGPLDHPSELLPWSNLLWADDLIADDAEPVTVWPDVGTRNYDLSVLAGAQAPVFRPVTPAYNNRATVEFDASAGSGAGTILTTGWNGAITTPLSVAVVCNINGSAMRMIGSITDGSTNASRPWGITGSGFWSTGSGAVSSTAASSTPHLAIIDFFNGTPDHVTAEVNGVEVLNLDIGVATDRGFMLGADQITSGISSRASGRVALMGRKDGALFTSTEKQNIREWAANYYDLTIAGVS